MTEILFLAFLAAVFSMDITAFGQFMISRPIVCAPIFGYLLGDIKTGLWVGMIVELIWTSVIPMGAAIPQDATSVAILSMVWGLASYPDQKGAMLLAMMLAALCGILFKQLDIWMRYYNVKIVHWVEQGVEKGDEARISKGIYIGLGLFLLKAFVFYAVLFVPGKLLVAWLYPRLAPGAVQGLELAWKMLPLAGMAVLLVNFRNGGFPFTRQGRS